MSFQSLPPEQYFCKSKNTSLKHLSAFVIFLFIFIYSLVAQSGADSLRQVQADSLQRILEAKIAQTRADSLQAVRLESARQADSVQLLRLAQHKQQFFTLSQEMLVKHPFFHFSAQPLKLIIEIKKETERDGIFYFILGLIVYFGLIRLFFYKYLSTLFTLFFRATLRQQQLREQLLQSPLPALLLNIFFAINVGTYLTFLAKYFKVRFEGSFWITLAYTVLIVIFIYLIKFLALKIAGWIFGISGVTDTYIFVVFLINKMIGVFLLPILVFLAFPFKGFLPIVLIISYLMLGCMLLYRFIISYRPVRSEIKLNKYYFILYLCAFELAPLLLIYKVLLSFLNSAY